MVKLDDLNLLEAEKTLIKRIAGSLNEKEMVVYNSTKTELLERMVDKYEQERENCNDRPVRIIAKSSNVDVDKIREELKNAYVGVAPVSAVEKMGMSLNDYQNISYRTWNNKVDKREQIHNASISLAEEVGEYLGVLKKELHHNHEWDLKKKIDELGDVLYYVARHCDLMGVTLEQVATKNLMKIGKRYPKGFSAEASQNRNE